jgi:hypothetical protein
VVVLPASPSRPSCANQQDSSLSRVRVCPRAAARARGRAAQHPRPVPPSPDSPRSPRASRCSATPISYEHEADRPPTPQGPEDCHASCPCPGAWRQWRHASGCARISEIAGFQCPPYPPRAFTAHRQDHTGSGLSGVFKRIGLRQLRLRPPRRRRGRVHRAADRRRTRGRLPRPRQPPHPARLRPQRLDVHLLTPAFSCAAPHGRNGAGPLRSWRRASVPCSSRSNFSPYLLHPRWTSTTTSIQHGESATESSRACRTSRKRRRVPFRERY